MYLNGACYDSFITLYKAANNISVYVHNLAQFLDKIEAFHFLSCNENRLDNEAFNFKCNHTRFIQHK